MPEKSKKHEATPGPAPAPDAPPAPTTAAAAETPAETPPGAGGTPLAHEAELSGPPLPQAKVTRDPSLAEPAAPTPPGQPDPLGQIKVSVAAGNGEPHPERAAQPVPEGGLPGSAATGGGGLPRTVHRSRGEGELLRDLGQLPGSPELDAIKARAASGRYRTHPGDLDDDLRRLKLDDAAGEQRDAIALRHRAGGYR